MNDAILSLLITSCAGVICLLIRYAFYSKCDQVKCCWCCEIHRQVNYENKESETNNNTNNNQEIQIEVKQPEQKIQTLQKKI
jgi:peptidoglycan hydrolase CwlO-like protein